MVLDGKKIKKQQFLTYAKTLNLDIRKVWKPLHKMNYLKKFQKMNLDNSIFVHDNIICLPSSPDIL